ncbi:MAG: VWA domain-containing protein [Pseudomonadales bacterium]|nr:VWA domain-containing protein [Pseudomonadales bacterium]
MDNLLIELAQFHFLRPEWFLALVPLAILLILLWQKRSAFGSWQTVIAPHLLPHLLQGSLGNKQRTPIVLLSIAWLVGIVALAGPTWQKHPQAVQKKVNAQIIVMDLSLSMFAQDISPSRLQRAKHKLSDILKKSNEGLTGLIVFSGTPHVVTPLTDDTRTILSMVDSLSPDIMPIPGSDPAAAVIKARDVLTQGGMPQGHIIVLTDDLPADFVDKVQDELNAKDTPVSIFAIGTQEGAPISLPDGNFVKDSSGAIVVAKVNESEMKTAARQLGGRFTTLTFSDEDVDYLLKYKSGLLDHEMKETERDFDTWDEAGHWLVLLILPFAAMGYRRGWLGAWLMGIVFVGALGTPHSAQAGIWEDLWQTGNQQGQQAWRQEKYDQAADKFTDPMWKGSAHYRAGNYEGAVSEFEKFDTADGHYNRGNALAKQQQLPEAIAAYEKALDKNPELEDAKANLEYLKKLLEQQQEQQQGDGEQQNPDQQSEQDQEQNQDQQDAEQNDQNQQQGEQQNQDQQQSQQEQSQQEQSQQSESSEQNDQQSQNQQSQEKEDNEDTEQQQQQAKNEQQESEQEEEQPQPLTPQLQESQQSAEDQQALQQWLERVPDEPGGLLRRKFKLESKLRNRTELESQAW